jgi:hypothetical protein
MATQSRRRSTRRERRSGTARPYTPVTASAGAAPRPVHAADQPLDYSDEFAFIRKDLVRILIWATILIGLMVALSFLPLGQWLPFL